MKSDRQAEIVRRLRCAAGHLNAVIEMADNRRPCEQVLHQLNAVQAALQVAGLRLLAGQTLQSESLILTSPSSKQRAAELKRLRSLYAILIQKPDIYNEVNR